MCVTNFYDGIKITLKINSRGVFKTLPIIYVGAVFVKGVNFQKLLTIFVKKSPLGMFDRVQNTLFDRNFKFTELFLKHFLFYWKIRYNKYSNPNLIKFFHRDVIFRHLLPSSCFLLLTLAPCSSLISVSCSGSELKKILCIRV